MFVSPSDFSAMRILLLSAYDAASHQYWRSGLVAAFPHWSWTVLTLPPRFFSWRVRGNPLSWEAWQRDEFNAGYDLIVATSMTDLATLRGICPALATVPALLYFHENQFAYPDNNPTRLLESQMVSIYSALAATTCVFNSDYNRRTFLDGAQKLLDRMPDNKPKNLRSVLSERSEVLPVPLTDPPAVVRNTRGNSDIPVLLWNHRWEHDKGPEILLHALRALSSMNQNFKLLLCGQRFRETPSAMVRVCSEFAEDIYHDGYLDSETKYTQVLSSADFVLSTALHEFQGLAVMQAVQQGCIPLVPDRLCYPEYFSAEYRYNTAAEEPASEGHQLAIHLTGMLENQITVAPDLDYLAWKNMAGRYQEILEYTAARRNK